MDGKMGMDDGWRDASTVGASAVVCLSCAFFARRRAVGVVVVDSTGGRS